MELHKIKSGSITKYVLLDDSMHLIQPVNRYLEYLRLRGRAENTLKAYGQDLKAFFIFLKRKGLSYEKVDAAMIQEYVEYLRSTHEDMIEIYVKSARTGSTINRMLGTLYGFYCYLTAVDDIENPMPWSLSVSPPVIFKDILYHTRKSNRTKKSVFKIKESTYHVHLLNSDEIRRMYEALTTERDKILFRFLLQSGARISEALSLRIDDIPVPDPTVPVTILTRIKSKGKYRNIYIPTELAIELDKFILERRSLVEANHDYLFTTQHPHYGNKQLSYRGIYEVFKRAAEKAGIEFKFHDTRHTYVSNLVESGMDISVVRILAGHVHVSTTQKYVTLSSEFIARSLRNYWNAVLPEGMCDDD